MKDIFARYQDFLQQDDRNFHSWLQAESERIEQYRREELEEIDQLNEAEICFKYNVDNKQEAKAIIHDYWDMIKPVVE